MSDVDPTPETPVTIRDALAFWRGELRGNPPANLRNLVAGLEAIYGSPGKSIAELWTKIDIIEQTLDLNLPNLIGRVSDLQDRIDKIQSALGAVPYNNLELGSVRGFLSALLQASTQFGILPSFKPGNKYQSNTTLSESGWRYAVFSAISGFALLSNNTVLDPSGLWSEWEVYIQSDAPACTTSQGEELISNSWYTFTDSLSRYFRVPSNYQLTVLIRSRVAGLLTQCQTFPVELATISYGNTNRYMMVPTGVWQTKTQDLIGNSYTKPIVCVGSLLNHTVVSSSSTCRVLLFTGGSGYTERYATQNPITINVTSIEFLIDYPGAAPSLPATVTICPPA